MSNNNTTAAPSGRQFFVAIAAAQAHVTARTYIPTPLTFPGEGTIVGLTKEAFNVASTEGRLKAIQGIRNVLVHSERHRIGVKRGLYPRSLFRILQGTINCDCSECCKAVVAAMMIVQTCIKHRLVQQPMLVELKQSLSQRLHRSSLNPPPTIFELSPVRGATSTTIICLVHILSLYPALAAASQVVAPIVSIARLLNSVPAHRACLSNPIVAHSLFYIRTWLTKVAQREAVDGYRDWVRTLSHRVVEIVSRSIRMVHDPPITLQLATALRVLMILLKETEDTALRQAIGEKLLQRGAGGASQQQQQLGLGGRDSTVRHLIDAVDVTGDPELQRAVRAVYHAICEGSYSRLVAGVGEECAAELREWANFQEH